MNVDLNALTYFAGDFIFLAQNTVAQDAAAKPALAPPGGGLMDMITLMGAVFLVFYFIVVRPQKKEQDQKKSLLDSLKKNDKVVTTSGMIGTVFRISDTDVILKVDEKNDIRVRFLRSSIMGKFNKDGKVEDTPEHAASNQKKANV